MTQIQIKPMVIERFAVRLPEFTLYPKKGGYWFRRQRDIITDILVCSASFKHGKIQFDLYCGVFEDWGGGYGTHLAWSGKRLANLRHNSNAISVWPVDQASYQHQQTEESIAVAIERGIDDIEQYALPFFEEFGKRVASHPLTAGAFQWIKERRESIPISVGTDIQSELASGGLYRITNPHFLGLQAYLREVSSRKNTSREDNKDISILVMDLFRRYTETNGCI
ncbi:MAG: hypothetical protein IT364_00080 [Candidatus Hydrogenedentes bacterium]|nr:hypothetical protein [Candidatus Hydrogenedentota bacterium]